MEDESQSTLPRLSSYTPKEPQKCIHTQPDIDKFTRSAAYRRLLTFIHLLNSSVIQKKISDPCHVSPVNTKSLALCRSNIV